MPTSEHRSTTTTPAIPSAPGQRYTLLHITLVCTGFLGRIHPLVLFPAWLGIAAIGSWPWQALRIPAACVGILSILGDGVGLIQLNRQGKSFGPATPSMLALAILRTGATFVLGWVSASLSCLLVCAVLQVLLSILVVYTTWIEPFRLEVTREKLRSSKMTTAHPLRLLHISDLHIERRTRREQGLLQVVKDLEPDIVALTGDYLNLSYTEDAEAHAEARAVLADLCRCVKGPVYAVTGSLAVDPPAVVPGIFADLPIVWVLDRVEELEIAGRELRIAGLRCTGQRHLDVPRLRRLLGGRSSTAFTLLLYHSPDLMPEAVEAGVDLYLCGHTHGGQIRLPMFGAIVTSSSFWKRYEMGRYDQAGTTMYVSRGVGMEGLGAPRARLLAPPEVTLWELSG